MDFKKILPLVFLTWTFSSQVFPEVRSLRGRESYIPGEILVRFQENSSPEDRAKALGTLGKTQAKEQSSLIKIKLAGNMNSEQAIQLLRNNSSVRYAQPNYRYYALAACTLPADTYDQNYATPESWPFLRIQMDKAVTALQWNLCPPGSGVTVAVLDTGISRNHPDLQQVPLIGYNAVFDAGDFDQSCTGYSGSVTDDLSGPVTASMDDFGHGTYVAGIIGASWGISNPEAQTTYYSGNFNACDINGVPLNYTGVMTTGIAGMVPGCVLMAVKVLDCTGGGSSLSIAKGIRFAVAHGAKVLNFSLGGGNSDDVEREAVNEALAQGCVVVASSGNDSNLPKQQASLNYPAGYPGVIAVGATGPNDEVASYSNGGEGLDLVAPGGLGTPFSNDTIADSSSKIFSSILCPISFTAVTECGFEPLLSASAGVTDPYFCVAAGTSAAAPFVSGAAALILSMNPALTNIQVAQAIINNTDSLNGNTGWDSKTGYGRLNVYNALLNAPTPGGGGQITHYVKTFNSPNPFYADLTGSTDITLAINQPQPVELSIYDTSGELVLQKNFEASEETSNPSNPQFKSYFISWDGKNGNGQPVKTGVYFYFVKTGGQTGHNKIALIRGKK